MVFNFLAGLVSRKMILKNINSSRPNRKNPHSLFLQDVWNWKHLQTAKELSEISDQFVLLSVKGCIVCIKKTYSTSLNVSCDIGAIVSVSTKALVTDRQVCFKSFCLSVFPFNEFDSLFFQIFTLFTENKGWRPNWSVNLNIFLSFSSGSWSSCSFFRGRGESKRKNIAGLKQKV